MSTTYEVQVNEVNMESHQDEAKAVESAKGYDGQAAVVMVEASGSYRSKTQVWPSRSETYTK